MVKPINCLNGQHALEIIYLTRLPDGEVFLRCLLCGWSATVKASELWWYGDESIREVEDPNLSGPMLASGHSRKSAFTVPPSGIAV